MYQGGKMKRSETIYNVATELIVRSMESDCGQIDLNYQQAQILADIVLTELEKYGMKPPTYINPKAYKKDPEIFDKGPYLAYCGYLDKYPSYYFEGKTRRPYEFYCEGWEDETEG